MEEQEKGFTIVDKRHGRESELEGERPPDEPTHGAGGADAPQEAAAEARAPAGGGAGPERELPAMEFSTFLLSLSTSALFHLGLVTEQEGEEPPEPDLPMARQTIDLLEILQVKTQGNLSEEEADLLERMLYELRMQFVEVQRRT